MPQAVTHGTKLEDRSIQIIGFNKKHLPVDMQLPIRTEHACNLIERETGGAPEGDQHQSFQHALIKQAAQAPPPDRCDKPFFLVVAKRRSRHAGSLRHFRNI